MLSLHISLCLPNDIFRVNFVNKVIVAYFIETFDCALLALICLYFDSRAASALSVGQNRILYLHYNKIQLTYHKAIFIIAWRKPVVRIVLFFTICILFTDVIGNSGCRL